MNQAPDPFNSRCKAVEFVVPFRYPVVFTRDVFHAQNPAFVDVFPRTPGRRHRLLVVADDGLVRAQPQLLERLNRYVAQFSSVFELVAPPAVIAGGESCKNDPAVLADLQASLAHHHIDRHSYVVAIGGGAVLDVVGYAAASVHRGVRLVRLPSTVLGQNDAGVGVKNGVNAFGQKNFLGTFAPPFAVVNDTTLLRSLSHRDLRAGMAEAVKVALIRDAEFFAWLCDNAKSLATFDEAALEYSIQRCAELHLDHIRAGGDPFEQGSARPLDFGHWVAHKLERTTQHRIRHGEAVAIGIALDTLYSARAGWLEFEEAARVLELLGVLGLPIDDPALHAVGEAGEWLVEGGLDEFREHLGGQLSVTFLHAIGRAETHHEVDVGLMRRCALELRNWTGAPGAAAPPPGALSSSSSGERA